MFSTAPIDLEFHALTPERWPNLEQLFGKRGACGGCWCMIWRLPHAVWEAGKDEGNRAAFRSLVEAGEEPGILAFAGDEAVAWCAVAPREDYPALLRSRILKPVDDSPVWSISCLFVKKTYRRMGVTPRLLDAAVAFARERGATIVEGYPTETQGADRAAPFLWTGTMSAFEHAGFCEVARRSARRPIMRRMVC